MIMKTPIALFLAFHFCCAAQTNLAEPVRIKIASKHAGRTVELRQSCYFGDLYDENEKWLLSPQPFAETYHIVDPDGAPIHPQGQRGIVPAGTSFILSRVEFPDLLAMNTRMLTTPRYNPWIYLRPSVASQALPTERQFFILLLPMDLETEEAVEQAIAELIAPQGTVTAWLAKRSPSIAAAIKHKEAAMGMNEEELIASMGKPSRWFVDLLDGQKAQVAWYPSREAWLVDGVIKDTRAARLISQPTPPKGQQEVPK